MVEVVRRDLLLELAASGLRIAFADAVEAIQLDRIKLVDFREPLAVHLLSHRKFFRVMRAP